MNKIKLYNRDGANLYLIKTDKEMSPNIFMWYLEVDKKHEWIFEHCRIIGDFNSPFGVDAIDPSGGPFLSVGDEFANTYKVVRIYSINNIWISERNNDK